jgi:hypothetical protein
MSMLPEIEAAVVAAAERRHAAEPAPTRRGFRGWARRTRILTVACGSLLVAVPAVAATQSWLPLLGKPSVDGASPSISADAVPADQANALGVLRREQSESDRDAATEGLLEPLAPSTDGVRLGDIRLLQGVDGPSVALVPVARLYKGVPSAGGTLLGRDALCLTDRATIACGTLDQLRSGGIVGSAGRFVFGLVPDGVTTVRFTYADGDIVDIPVRENFYGRILPKPAARDDDTPRALFLQRDPRAADDEAPSPATVSWLDARGAVLQAG